MLATLAEKEKRLKNEINELQVTGRLDHLVDPENPQKYNGDGISVSICKGRKRRVYDDAIQAEIDVLQKQIDKKYVADRKGDFTDSSRLRTGA